MPMPIRFDIVNIGYLSMNKFWGETERVRSGTGHLHACSARATARCSWTLRPIPISSNRCSLRAAACAPPTSPRSISPIFMATTALASRYSPRPSG